MSQAQGHLDEAQIQAYVTGSVLEPEAQKWFEAHLADCESCLNRLLEAERIHLGLLEGDGMKRTPYPGCPAEETLQELAAGICAPDIAETAREHAAQCNYCGPLLSRYLKEFSDDVEAEDAALLQELKTSTPKWQKNFVRENALTPVSVPWFSAWWPRLAAGAAAAAAVAIGSFVYLRPNDLQKAQRLVASAYGERRTTEMRLTDVPYAQYSPLPFERGGDAADSIAYQRPSWLRAKAAVGEKLKSQPHVDPRWLQIQARVDLLEATPVSTTDAQEALERARTEGLTSPSLDIDLAASSFARASTEDNPDLLSTINLLRTALDDPKISKQEQLAALFDLGIAYQKSKMFDWAIETWNKYLQLDPSSEWANEARERLDKAKKAKKEAPPPKTQSYLDTQTPLFFLNHSDDSNLLEHLDVYQDRALRFWLTEAVRHPTGDSARAIRSLAQLLEEHDLDSWMWEFLADIGPDQEPAVEALSAAIRANKKGFYGLAVERAQQATALFAGRANRPGELRARFESIYASQRFLEGFDCLAQIASLQTPDRYQWLRIQLDLEKYTCSNFGGDFAATERGLEGVFGNAEKSHFQLLALRAVALEASIRRQQRSECHESWQHAIKGLGLYWMGGPYPPERLYEFYSILEQCAAQAGMWHAAEALQRHSIGILESFSAEDDPNLTIAGSAHAELAAVMTAEHRDGDAAAEQNAAESVWNRAGDEQTASRYRLFMRIHLAEIQLKRGDAKQALATLRGSSTLLNSTQYQLLSLNFYRLLGNSYRGLGSLPEAASAYASGITIAENSLRTLQIDGKERLQWVAKMDDVYRGLTEIWLEQGKTNEAWKLWEWYRTRSLIFGSMSGRTEGAAAISWQQIEAEIAKVNFPSGRHLVYASFADGLQAWTVSSAGAQGHWIEIQQTDLERRVNDFAKICADQSSPLSDVHGQAQTLYGVLLQPVASELSDSTVVIVERDKPLSRLVLPALMTPEGLYFGKNHAVVYSPGVLAERYLRPPLPIERTDRLLLLDASQSDGPGSVPGHLEEREAASHAYSHIKLVTGDQTTAAEVKRELSRSTVFDFIGHGEQHGSRTVLRVSADTFLGPEDFTPKALSHIKLGILAACSTGAGGDDRLLDTDNLVHSFLFAGVPDVIASQWNVDSAATTELMQTLLARLGAGEPVSQAMYQAQKAMLTARDHPYYWAGFSVSGRAN